MQKIVDWLKDILFPPFCVSCDKLLSLGTTVPLCQACLNKWELEKKTLCPECHREHIRCECIPPILKGTVSGSYHLARYPKWDCVAKKMILNAKNNPYTYLFRFQADELADLIRSQKWIDSQTVICYAPRDPEKIRSTGVDQARLTASLLSKRLSLPLVHAFVRKKGLSQKDLHVHERLENARGVYRVREGVESLLIGKKVILYDDVLTTGSTLLVLSDLLLKLGVSKIIVLTIGRTIKEKSMKDQEISEEEDLEDCMENFSYEDEFGE
jgi:ComF family protein